MANFFRVNLYKRWSEAGVSAIRPVEGGPLGQRKVRGNADNITLISALGLSSDDNQVFEVKINGAKPFITDWSGISDFGNFVRVNRYRRALQEDGTTKWQYFGIGQGSSARVVPQNVATAISVQVNGVDENGDDQGQECFRITLIDGTQFVTDHDGWDAIKNY